MVAISGALQQLVYDKVFTGKSVCQPLPPFWRQLIGVGRRQGGRWAVEQVGGGFGAKREGEEGGSGAKRRGGASSRRRDNAGSNAIDCWTATF